jgi:Flp pilus assembly protein CpaB
VPAATIPGEPFFALPHDRTEPRRSVLLPAIGFGARQPGDAVPAPQLAESRAPAGPAGDRRRRERAREARLLVARYRPLLLSLAALVVLLSVVQALAPPSAATQPVLVAARDLAAGNVITDADLRQVDWPADLSPPPGDPATAAGLLGRSLASPVRAGEAVTDARLLGPGVLTGQPAGTLAVPVRLADATAATLVAVGDRVDLIAGASPDGAAFGAGPSGSDVVASDVLVLAVPGRADDVTGGLGALAGGGDEPGAAAAGVLVVATDRGTAVRLAGAQAGHVLSVAVRAGPRAAPP